MYFGDDVCTAQHFCREVFHGVLCLVDIVQSVVGTDYLYVPVNVERSNVESLCREVVEMVGLEDAFIVEGVCQTETIEA